MGRRLRPGLVLACGLLVLGAATVAGCSPIDGEEVDATTTRAAAGATATPSPTARTIDPASLAAPHASLAAGGQSVTVEAGTRCWPTAGTDSAFACVDFVAPVSNARPLDARAAPLALTFEAGPPSEVHLQWFRVTGPTDGLGPDGTITWDVPLTEQVEGATTLDAPLPPGHYLLTVFAVWRGLGDISYAFSVQR